MRLERAVPVAVGAGEAWRVLSALPPARGSAAGYLGTAVVEEADDEARTATLRLHGAAGAATVAATAAVTVHDAGLAITAVVRDGLGGAPLDEETAEDVLGRLATTLAYALAAAGRPRSAWDEAPIPSRSSAAVWDAPSPPAARPSRPPIPDGATLSAALIPDGLAAEPPAAEPPAVASPPPPASPPAEPAAASPPPPASLPAVISAGLPEVLTPRPHDVIHPGAAPAPEPEPDRARWVRVGVAAAAGLALLQALRSRR